MTDDQKMMVQMVTHILMEKFPETVGFGVIQLSCGCLVIGCFNAEGCKSGPTMATPSYQMGSDTASLCKQCLDDLDDPDSRGKRVTGQELFWPDGSPSKEVDAKIYSRVFGDIPKGETLH